MINTLGDARIEDTVPRFMLLPPIGWSQFARATVDLMISDFSHLHFAVQGVLLNSLLFARSSFAASVLHKECQQAHHVPFHVPPSPLRAESLRCCRRQMFSNVYNLVSSSLCVHVVCVRSASPSLCLPTSLDSLSVIRACLFVPL